MTDLKLTPLVLFEGYPLTCCHAPVVPISQVHSIPTHKMKCAEVHNNHTMNILGGIETKLCALSPLMRAEDN
jgi:hypothetical protein